MAAANALDSHPDTLSDSPLQDSSYCVAGAGGMVGTLAGHERAEPPLVEANGQDEQSPPDFLDCGHS